jgi:hypothetical protein
VRVLFVRAMVVLVASSGHGRIDTISDELSMFGCCSRQVGVGRYCTGRMVLDVWQSGRQAKLLKIG